MSPSEINAPPSLEQLYAMFGEVVAENRVLKSIIAAHPEVIAATMVPEPPAESAPEE